MHELQPGREMDAAVFRVLHPELRIVGPFECDVMFAVNDADKREARHSVRHYSTDIADAFAALDAVMEKHPQMGVLISWHPGAQLGAGAWGVALIGDDTPHLTWGATHAEAVCRAILALAEAEHVS